MSKMSYNTLNMLNLTNKTVLLRADLNVPVQGGVVSDFTRIDRLKPTIDFLRSQNTKIVVISHFGRPKGNVNPDYSLSFLTTVLIDRWSCPVHFSEDCIGTDAKAQINDMGEGEIILLENLRFHAGEETNDKAFAAALAQLGDFYVNDAFSATHRAHASIDAITRLLPSAAGLLVEEELRNLEQILKAPERPMAAVVGGAKVSTKLSLLKNLVTQVDYLVLGGGMANTFMLAQGLEIGKSLAEAEMIGEVNDIMQAADASDCQIVLPIDVNCAKEFAAGATCEIQTTSTISDNLMVLDVGPESIQNVKEILESCKTVIWNGPMGAFEIQPFDIGTNALAQVVAKLTKDGKVKSVAGGGDTVAALDGTDSSKDFTYISTAGGAFLEWLEGNTLPGIAALENNKKAA
jgi:phosphoglycerate kinase